ncbi:hypothetical protein GO986_12810 [Deinococcus sp. HMF7620]|uniref:Uncharacterized protein n=1 Tax=Deinococcus arboris TaxID=2682977 RepID=A0A7C9M9F0_9DEIO|nr:hypothetical protein [Deinococcus arboris]MVN87643.1 hypothetical protein [Deinococcus arboris]
MPVSTALFRQALTLIQADTRCLWPNFVPAAIPYLIYDGHGTVLWRAPSPEPGWQEQKDAWVYPGRHPSVTANTATRLPDGRLAASLMLSSLDSHLTALQLAGLAVHEAFHVYQEGDTRGLWDADELAALTYPVADPFILAARALESAALQRALRPDANTWPLHAGRALAWRQARCERLAAEHVTYERAMERKEGLAHYVELGFAQAVPVFPPVDCAAEAVRQRAYTTGAAYALLLDRLSLDWKTLVEASGAALDELLAAHILPAERGPMSPEVQAWAGAEAARVAHRQQEARRTFEGQRGQRLVLRSVQPLWLRGFDPLNTLVLGEGAVLHHRFLQFANGAVEGEVLGQGCLTVAAGLNPLLSGFREIIIPGLEAARLSGDGFTLEAGGVRIRSHHVPLQANTAHAELSLEI